jgi:hypothetical protein
VLLLELPGLSNRILPRRSNVFHLACRCRMAEDARTHFQQVAEQRGRVADELYQEVLVSEDEFAVGSSHISSPEQLRLRSLSY